MNLWDLESITKIWSARSVSLFFLSDDGFFFSLTLMNLQNHDLMHLIVAFGFMQPPKNSLDIFTPTWFTSSTFLDKDDHRKFVAGTNFHQVNFNSITCYASTRR